MKESGPKYYSKCVDTARLPQDCQVRTDYMRAPPRGLTDFHIGVAVRKRLFAVFNPYFQHLLLYFHPSCTSRVNPEVDGGWPYQIKNNNDLKQPKEGKLKHILNVRYSR